MDLLRASAKFDNDPLYEAYSGDYLYTGQFASYDGSQLDGSFIRRRTVSLRPDYILPERRAVTLYGEVWVVSDPIVDGFKGRPVRQTMSARKSHGLFEAKTAGQLALQLPGVKTLHAFKRWLKYTADASTSDYESGFEFSVSKSEGPLPRFLCQDLNVWHIRGQAEVAEGFWQADADQLVEDSSGFVMVQTEGRRDPVTLQPVPGATYSAVMTERYNNFRKTDQDQPSNYAGDKTLIVAKFSAPTPTGTLHIDGKDWVVLASDDLGDGWGLHIRRS